MIGRKACSITAVAQQRSNEAAAAALHRARASGSTVKLEAIANRSERLMRAWIAAGRPNDKAAIDRIVRQVDGVGR